MARLIRSPLIQASIVCLFGLFLSLFLWQIDSREWLGVNVWIKPAKFFLSIAVYLSTLYFYIGWIEGMPQLKARLAQFSIISMSIELACIVLQSIRGVGSHFNTALPLDGMIYGIMGVFAFAQIPFAAILLFYLWKYSVPLPRTLKVGIYWGLAVFLLGCIEAGFMASGTGHFVGGNGGATIPFLGWSLDHGDLRVAHFVGLHGLQLFALMGFALQRFRNGSIFLQGMGLTYFLWVMILWWMALAGKPVV
jgi:hypothetical protein